MLQILGIAFLSLIAGSLSIGEVSGAEREQVALVIPHTHWEGAVFKTREEYLDIGLPHILKALYLLKKYPDYRFVLDQMCYVRPFIERYPAEIAVFRELLSQGRLQIAGGTDTMHDNNIPSGESIVRQYLLSKSYFRDKLGYDVTTGWGLDTFGHNAQMPQILKLAGMKSYWFQRGVPGIDTPSEFLWQGIDGTQIPAFWLPIGYGALHNVPPNDVEFSRRIRSLFDSLTPFTRGPERVLMAGADVWEPEEQVPLMIDRFNRSDHPPFRLRLSLPSDYEVLVAKRSDRPVIRGELNPVFQGIYSTRIEVKQAMRDMERLLTTAEKLNVIATTLGAPSDREMIERAWEPVLFNQAHDLSSGVMVDKVYDDSMQRYHQARRLADEVVHKNVKLISSKINTAGQGEPIVVFNTLGWPRSDIAEVDVAFSNAGVQTFALVDSEGHAQPVQYLGVLRNDDGGIRQARIAFIAQNVPAMGYTVYHAVPNATGSPSGAAQVHRSMHEDSGAIENEFYRASFDLWTGQMTSLVLKENQWEALSAPGNVVAREHDGGDFWELYGTLNGGRLTAMKKEIPPPRAAYTQWSRDFVGGSGIASSGPVFSEFRIAHPLGKNQFATRVRMYQGLRRIDISTELLNQEEFVRYRVVFPTSVRNGKAVHEIPFGAIERAERQEFPAQNWIDYSDGERGVALINRGVPGNNVADGKLMLSLMRSTRLISYGYIGGFEPGVGSDTGLGIGKKYTLDYAVLPHRGNWQDAAPWRAGLELNNPLIAMPVAPHAGELPAKWSLLESSHSNVVVSALKPGRNGTGVLRVYEAAGKPVHNASVKLRVAISRLQEANLIEDTLRDLETRNDGFSFDLKPYEIRTFKFALKAQTVARR
jgi:alpha-mannosidase